MMNELEPLQTSAMLAFLDRHPRLGLTAAALGVAGLVGCGPGASSAHHDTPSISISQPEASSSAATPSPTESSPSAETTELQNPALAMRAAEIISTFENSTLEVQYGYAENIDDGRGVTAGRAGFCTSSDCGGDMLRVIQNYTQKEPGNPLEKYIPALKAAEENDSADGLNGLVQAWEAAGKDPVFREAQDEAFDDIYFKPSLQYDREAGITSAAGQLVVLDTIVQHGEGDDPDGLPAIMHEAIAKLGTVHGNEEQWLEKFLDIRRQHLLHAADPDTAAAWKESVSRVDALKQITREDLSLKGPLSWTVYGDDYKLPAVQ